MKKKKSTSNPTWQAFKQHKRGWLALRILAVLFVITLLAPLWSNDKPLWIRYQGEYFFPLVTEYNETAFGGDFDTPADYLDPLIRHNITSDGNFALYLPNPYDADTLNDFDTAPDPAKPSERHILGTDDRGRDLLARLVYGFRDSLLFAAGGIAAVGSMNIHVMVALLLAAAVLGDAANFMIGKFFGRKLFANPDSKIFRQSYLEKTHAFYEKHGGKTIIIARFVPIVRTFAPFVAGMGSMHYGTFIRYNIIGAVLWVLSFSYAGYFFANIPVVKNNLALVMVAIIVISILPGVVEVLRARRAAKK